MYVSFVQHRLPDFALLVPHGHGQLNFTDVSYADCCVDCGSPLWHAQERGNMLKVDRHNYVKVAYHGFKQLEADDRKVRVSVWVRVVIMGLGAYC